MGPYSKIIRHEVYKSFYNFVLSRLTQQNMALSQQKQAVQPPIALQPKPSQPQVLLEEEISWLPIVREATTGEPENPIAIDATESKELQEASSSDE